MKQPILITGIQRSGATIVTKILGLAGAELGEVSQMQENIVLRKWMDSYYRTLNADVKGHYPLPEEVIVPKNTQVVLDLFSKSSAPFAYKDSRNGQVWKMWHSIFPNTKWVIVRRRTGDVVDSCLKTGYMTAYKNPKVLEKIGKTTAAEGWLWWVRKQEERYREMLLSGLDCRVVYPERIVEGDYFQMYELVQLLGLQWHDSIIEQIDPMVMKTRNKIKKLC